MPSQDAKVVEARQEQSKAAKRATLDLLRSKKRQEKELKLLVNGEELSFLLRAVSAREYDRLVTDCPPNIEQRAAGASFNINKFAPTLLAHVVAEPEMSADEWTELWNSPDWNRGELMTFFGEAVDLCNTGLSLGPTATG